MQIIKFKITTPDVENFLLKIEMPSNKTFLDFHYAIIQAVDFDPQMNYTFFLSDACWDYKDEIILECWDETSQGNLLLMSDTTLDHFDPKKGQRYLYVFDDINQRGFFIEVMAVRSLTPKEKIEHFPKYATEGNIPKQFDLDKNFDEIEEQMNVDLFDNEDDIDDINLGEDEYGAFSADYDDYEY